MLTHSDINLSRLNKSWNQGPNGFKLGYPLDCHTSGTAWSNMLRVFQGGGVFTKGDEGKPRQ